MSGRGGNKFAAKTIIVMGDTGHGKSSLIKNLQSTVHAKMYGKPEVAEEGGNPKGTTKEPNVFGCKIGPHDVLMYDTPGLGDPTVKICKTLADINERITQRGIDLIIVCQDLTQDNTSNNFISAKEFIDTLNIDKSWDSKWDRVLLVGTKLDRAKQLVKAEVFTQEAVDRSWQGKVDVFFEQSDGPKHHVQMGRYEDAKKKAAGILDTRALASAILRSKCFGEKGSAGGGRNLRLESLKKWDAYVKDVADRTGRDQQAIKELMDQYKKQKKLLDQVVLQTAESDERLKQFRKTLKKRKAYEEEKIEKFNEAERNLMDMKVPELKEICVQEGIKKVGVGWPTCCPPDGLKDSIVNMILAQKYID